MSLSNQVSGSSAFGALTLNQTANGGNGGFSYGGTAGAAGAGASYLVVDDTKSAMPSYSLTVGNAANGGGGGAGTNKTNGVAGGAATAKSTITGAQNLSLTTVAAGGKTAATPAMSVRVARVARRPLFQPAPP